MANDIINKKLDLTRGDAISYISKSDTTRMKVNILNSLTMQVRNWIEEKMDNTPIGLHGAGISFK